MTHDDQVRLLICDMVIECRDKKGVRLIQDTEVVKTLGNYLFFTMKELGLLKFDDKNVITT
jgi:hypothetical protein